MAIKGRPDKQGNVLAHSAAQKIRVTHEELYLLSYSIAL